MITYDFLWKSIIEELFVDFLRFFFKKNVRQFDLKRGFEFLDKELEQLFPKAEINERRVDKLVKVYLKTGEEVWILVHIEVQGYKDGKFEHRMFVYFYRIFDRFQKEITALAILTDKDPNYRPSQFKTGFGKTQMTYKFPTYKVIDQDFEDLEASKSCFAVVIQTVLIALRKGTIAEEQLLDLKLDLCKRLLAKKFAKLKIQALLNFISFYIRLDKTELKLNFEQNLDNLQNKRFNMTVREAILHHAKLEGKLEGELKGDYQRLKKSVQAMRNKGLSIIEIADYLDEELSVLQKIFEDLDKKN